MGGVRTPPGAGKVVGERIIYVDKPEIREKYHRELEASRQGFEAELKEARSVAVKLRAELHQATKQLEAVTRDRERLANLKAQGPVVAPQPVAAPANDRMEKLQFQNAKLKDELAAAVRRIEEMTAAAAVPAVQKVQDPVDFVSEPPKVEVRTLVVERIRFDWIAGLGFLGALVGFVIGKALS